MGNSLRHWLVIAFLVPVLAEVAVSFLLVMFPSGAYAEGFAYIAVLVGLIIAIPVTLIVNSALVPRAANWSSGTFARSLIVPGVYTLAIMVYYTGFWDKVVDPLLPQQEIKIDTASGGWIDDDTWESFFIVNSYEGSEGEQTLIENYVIRQFQQQSRQDPAYASRNEDFYFVPRELYDPIDLTVSRENAVAVFQFEGGNGDTDIRRLR